MEWIVFGDDWGAHPSTTQHLVLNLPNEDSVIWVDSIGMRSPRLRRVDLERIWGKAKRLLSASEAGAGLYEGSLASFQHVRPKVLPWHKKRAAVRFNQRRLRKELNAAGIPVKPFTA